MRFKMLVAGLALLGNSVVYATAELAFDGAEGFGQYTQGGVAVRCWWSLALTMMAMIPKWVRYAMP